MIFATVSTYDDDQTPITLDVEILEKSSTTAVVFVHGWKHNGEILTVPLHTLSPPAAMTRIEKGSGR